VRLAKAEAASFEDRDAAVRRMIMGGRESKTWFVVAAQEVRTKRPLRTWVQRAVDFAGTLTDGA